MYPFCFFQDDIYRLDQVGVAPQDIGVIRGYAIFEFFRTYNGRPFLLEQYLDRFFNSAAGLNLTPPYSADQITAFTNELLEKNEIKEGAIRMVLTGGATSDGISLGTPTFYMLAQQVPHYPASYYEQGIKMKTYPWVKSFPRIKTTHYVEAIKLQNYQKRHQAHDLLFYNDNAVSEGTRSNFFLIKGKHLITPDKGVLIGRTRNLVLQLAAENYSVQERTVELEEIQEADEAFITSTSKQIMPVTQIDQHLINRGKVGSHTRYLMEQFHKFTDQF